MLLSQDQLSESFDRFWRKVALFFILGQCYKEKSILFLIDLCNARQQHRAATDN